MEEEAVQAEAQAMRVAAHASRIADHNRRIAERDRLIAEEKMVEQARRESHREWVESMTQLMQSAPGNPHSFNFAPEFQSAYAHAPQQVSYGYYPQPAYYAQAPAGYAQRIEPQPGHPPHPQIAYYMPVVGAPGNGNGAPPLMYHYSPGPGQTTYAQYDALKLVSSPISRKISCH